MNGLGLLTATFLILPTLIAGYLAVYAWRRRTTPPALSFTCSMIAVCGWCLTAALVVTSTTPQAARFWLNMMFAVVPFLPVAILATASQAIGTTNLVSRARLPLWLVIPIITAALSLTSSSAYYHDVQFVQSDGQYIGWTNRFGLWAIVHIAYTYSLIFYAILITTRQFMQMRFRTYRIRILLILVVLLVPFLTNIYNTFGTQVHYFTNPIVFNVIAPLLFWVVFRYRLFDLAPIARDQAFEQMDDAIIIIDTENQVVDVNSSAAHLVGQKAAELVARPVLEAFSTYERALSQILNDLSSQLTIQMGEGQHEQYFDLRATPIEREHKVVGKMILLRDTTQQRQAEKGIRRTEAERERLNSISQFVEAASHEFRTPLSVIKTATYLINRVEDPTRRTEKTAQIDGEVDRLTQLVDALLMVINLNEQVALSFYTLDVNMLAHGIEAKAHPEAEAANLRLILELTPGLPTIMGNAHYLQEALYALVDNAIRYTPANGSITIRTAQADNQIIMTVQDTGIGIAPDHLPYIFDAFYRVDKAHSTSGFGIGLAIARRVITLHGGKIQATSEVGVGTTIEMRFRAAVKSNR